MELEIYIPWDFFVLCFDSACVSYQYNQLCKLQLRGRMEQNKAEVPEFRKLSFNQVPELLIEPSKELPAKLWWG